MMKYTVAAIMDVVQQADIQRESKASYWFDEHCVFEDQGDYMVIREGELETRIDYEDISGIMVRA